MLIMVMAITVLLSLMVAGSAFSKEQAICPVMGGKVNKDAMYILAKNIPFELLKKNKENELFISAMIFGIAGFLEAEFKETYPSTLKLEFDFLRRK